VSISDKKLFWPAPEGSPERFAMLMNERVPESIIVREITARDTIDIRWPVLRAGMPRDSAVFPGDDHPSTRHFGAFNSAERLVAVASIYLAPFPEQPAADGTWQLRGMAVTPDAQRRGFGGALVRACLNAVAAAGGDILWCNARTPAVPFYLLHGFQQVGVEFDIPTAGPHRRMWRRVRT
jgi:GNAT superfamily N-acetyltransferase